jgi:hypothetical protein
VGGFRADYDSALRNLLAALEPFRREQPLATSKKKTKGYAFLSYAEEDAEFVDELKGFLAKRGYSYWDYRESDRDYQQDLYLELEGVIAEASATLSFLPLIGNAPESPSRNITSRQRLGYRCFCSGLGIPAPRS